MWSCSGRFAIPMHRASVHPGCAQKRYFPHSHTARIHTHTTSRVFICSHTYNLPSYITSQMVLCDFDSLGGLLATGIFRLAVPNDELNTLCTQVSLLPCLSDHSPSNTIWRSRYYMEITLTLWRSLEYNMEITLILYGNRLKWNLTTVDYLEMYLYNVFVGTLIVSIFFCFL